MVTDREWQTLLQTWDGGSRLADLGYVAELLGEACLCILVVVGGLPSTERNLVQYAFAGL